MNDEYDIKCGKVEKTAPTGAGKDSSVDKELAMNLNKLLIKFMGLHHQKFLRAFRACECCCKKLKKNQEKLIGILYFEGSATPSELSMKLDLEKGGITTLLDSLEDMGFISREEVPCDRRKNIISLTAEGRAYMERVMLEHQEILLKILKKLDRTEVDELIGSLKRAIEIIERL